MIFWWQVDKLFGSQWWIKVLYFKVYQPLIICRVWLVLGGLRFAPLCLQTTLDQSLEFLLDLVGSSEFRFEFFFKHCIGIIWSEGEKFSKTSSIFKAYTQNLFSVAFWRLKWVVLPFNSHKWLWKNFSSKKSIWYQLDKWWE